MKSGVEVPVWNWHIQATKSQRPNVIWETCGIEEIISLSDMISNPKTPFFSVSQIHIPCVNKQMSTVKWEAPSKTLKTHFIYGIKNKEQRTKSKK